MNDVQLEYFVTIAQAGSFSRGAEKLFVSTPAASKQISALEKELGFQVFTRTSRGVELTPQGAMMLEYTQSTRARFTKLMDDVKKLEKTRSHWFRLGIVESWLWGEPLTRIRAALREMDPELELLVLPGHSTDLLDWLGSGEADAIINMTDGWTGRHSKESSGSHFYAQHLTYIHRGLLYSSTNPLADKPDLRPADFAGQPLYTLSNGKKFLAEEGNELICHAYGFSPEIIALDKQSSIFHTISAGFGFTIVDEWNYASHTPAFRWLPLMEQHDVILCWERESPAVQTLSRLCAEELFRGP